MESTEPYDDRPPPGRSALPTLRVLHAGTSPIAVRAPVWLAAGRIVLGREATVDGLAFPEDRRLSRAHAEIVLSPRTRELRVRDLGSRNGTFVDGAPVSERALADGEVLRVGDTFLIVRGEPSPPLDAEVPSIVGVSPAARALRHTIARVGVTGATVLVLGETGTGKEVTARALHDASGRTGPFVAVNCAAIPTELAESQLFGHAAFAFTGARTAQPGFFRAAHGGTLFLDEIGDLPAPLQPKLLRAVEERAVVPVGSTTPVRCDVRLIAATNADLDRAIARGAFRADLYARLAEVIVRLPPLGQRREDILPLLARGLDDARRPLTPRLVDALLRHPWPFNVREVLKLAAVLRLDAADGDALDLAAVADRLAPRSPAEGAEPFDEEKPPATPADRAAAPPVPTRAELIRLLEEHRGNISHIADRTGRSRRQVQRWLEQAGLDASDYRTDG